MHHQIDPEAARLIAESRGIVETSRRIVVQSRRNLEYLQGSIAESWRMLETARRAREHKDRSFGATPLA